VLVCVLFYQCRFCFTHSYLIALVQANPYWSMMHTNSYKYAYSGAGNYFSYGNVYDVDDCMYRVDDGHRIWDDSTPVNNTDSANVVPQGQGGETPSATANSTAEECKLKPRIPVLVSFENINCLVISLVKLLMIICEPFQISTITSVTASVLGFRL
jgi:hypothetical protein